MHSLLDVFTRIIETDPPAERLLPLRHEVLGIEQLATAENVPNEDERRELVEHVHRVLDRLPSPRSPQDT